MSLWNFNCYKHIRQLWQYNTVYTWPYLTFGVDLSHGRHTTLRPPGGPIAQAKCSRNLPGARKLVVCMWQTYINWLRRIELVNVTKHVKRTRWFDLNANGWCRALSLYYISWYTATHRQSGRLTGHSLVYINRAAVQVCQYITKSACNQPTSAHEVGNWSWPRCGLPPMMFTELKLTRALSPPIVYCYYSARRLILVLPCHRG